MTLLLKRRGVSLPTGQARLADDLRGYSPFALYTPSSGFIDLINKRTLTPGANVIHTATPSGLGLYYSSTTNSNLSLDSDADNVLSTSATTWIAVITAKSTSVGADTGHIGYQGAASDRAMMQVIPNSGTLRWDFGNATSGSGRLSVSSVTVVVDTLYTHAVVADSSDRGREIWMSGRLLASDTAAKATRASTSSAFDLLNAPGSSARANYVLHAFAGFNSALPQEVIRKLTSNPALLFARRRRMLPSASVALPTLSAATYVPGSITSTGFRPRVTAS